MSKLRKAAKDQPCALQIPGRCNHDWSTSVLAHLRQLKGGGVGLKPPDTHAVIACSACHDALDGRVFCDEFMADKWFYIARALVRTYDTWMRLGLIDQRICKR